MAHSLPLHWWTAIQPHQRELLAAYHQPLFNNTDPASEIEIRRAFATLGFRYIVEGAGQLWLVRGPEAGYKILGTL